MNLLLIPKYKKFNRTLHQVFTVSTPRRFRQSPNSNNLPVPIKIEPYKKRREHIRIRTPSRDDSRLSRILYKKTTRRESYDDPEKGCGLSRWCARKKAERNYKKEHDRELKRAEEWSRWKFKESERVEHAKREEARLKREAEFARQIAEIEEQKRLLAKNTLKSHYPHPVTQRTPPKEIFPTEDLPKTPYYPKHIDYDQDDYEVIKQKRWRDRLSRSKEIKTINKYKEPKARKQKIKKKRPRNENKKSYKDLYESKNITLHKCKCRIGSYIVKFKQKRKKKEYVDTNNTKKRREEKTPYTADTYKKYDTTYNTPKETTKYKEEEPYTYTKNYEEPTSSKRADDADVHTQHNAIYGRPTKSKKKITKGRMKKEKDRGVYTAYKEPDKKTKKIGNKAKKLKFKEYDTDKKRKLHPTASERFVNCFYRTCCECYCWFSIFLIIGFVIIMVV